MMEKQSKLERLVCKDVITEEQAYKAILRAIKKKQAEIYVVVERSGRAYFSAIDLAQIYDLLAKTAKAEAEAINEEIYEKDSTRQN